VFSQEPTAPQQPAQENPLRTGAGAAPPEPPLVPPKAKLETPTRV